MKVDRRAKICGVSVKCIRDFFRRYRTPYSFTLKTLKEGLDLTDCEAVELADELVKQRFVEMEDADKYVITVKGNALAQAKFVSRISKDKADLLFNEFIKRVGEVDVNDKFIYRVKRLILFGSYLDGVADDYGDIDIAYELERKIGDDEAFWRANEKLVNEAYEQGKRFSSVVEEFAYGETLVLRYLRNRSPYISLHRVDDIHELGAKHRQIYP